MLRRLSRLWDIIVYMVAQYMDDECSRTAAALAYSTLLAIVPLMLVTLSIASKIPSFAHITNNVQHFILENFVAGAANSVSGYLNEFLKQVNKLSWTSIVAFTVTALLLLYNMVQAFNRVWAVKMVWHRKFTLRFLFYFAILLVTPVLLAIVILVVSYVTSLSFFSGARFHHLVGHPLLVSLPYIASFITFSFFNWVLPTCRVKLRFAFVSGIITTCFFELIKYLFTLYVSIFPTYRLIYGALATIPIFFLWVYLSWTLILIGAILCKGLQDHFYAHSHQVFED